MKITTKYKKWLFLASIALNIFFFITIIVMWPQKKIAADLSKLTQHDLSKAQLIQNGMSREEVQKILGIPAQRELERTIEEWHYCKTGHSIDEYVAISFENDRVIKLANYTVSWLDMAFHHTKAPTKEMVEVGGLGDCINTVRWGTYNQKTPSYPVNPSANNRNDITTQITTPK